MKRLCESRRARAGEHRNRQRGAAAVEFALILPFFCLILFGIVEYGWIFYEKFNLASAVRDGLRQGVTISQAANPDPATTAVQVATTDLQRLGVAAGDISLTATYAGAAPTKTMTLTGQLTYHKVLGFVPVPSRLTYAMTMMLELQ